MGNRLRLARDSKQLSQADIARLIGVNRQILSAIERGEQEPSPQLALKISEVLEIPVEQIFLKDDQENMSRLTVQLEGYQMLLDGVFGVGTCLVNTKQTGVNNIVGAISFSDGTMFQAFSTNYSERLYRLKELYQQDAHAYDVIKRLAQEVATGQGVGAYAELATIDYVGRMVGHVIGKPSQLDLDIPPSRTYAANLSNRQIANVDGYIEELNTYFDVKAFRDISDDILNKPIHQLGTKYEASILPERDYSYDYSLLQNALPTIKQELETGLKNMETYVKVNCVPGLAFRICWPPGVNVASGTFDPYRAAMIQHKRIFEYADKFVLDAPFVLFLVTPPWTDTAITDFQDMDNTLHRAISRRVFCQYIDKPEVQPKYGKTYDELSKAISMIVFLNLHDGLGDSKETITAHAFANPNANHRYPGFWRDFFSSQRLAIQDFTWDNY